MREEITFTLATKNSQQTMSLALDDGRSVQKLILDHIRHGMTYEQELSFFLLKVLQEGDFFIDAGANVGYFTVLAARLVGESGRVFAFEPECHNYACLEENIKLNRFGCVKPFNVALGEADREALLYLNSDNDGGHALWDVGLHPDNEKSRASSETRPIMMRSLDSILAAYGDLPVKAIKIDTEGSEHNILRGALVSMARQRIPFIVTEINGFALDQAGSSERQLRKFMAEQGYEAYLMEMPESEQLYFRHLPTDRDMQGSYVVNVLFTTQEHLARFGFETLPAAAEDAAENRTSLLESLRQSGQMVTQLKIVDIGAMSLGSESYAALLAKGGGSVVGFEPVESECANLNSLHAGTGNFYLPYVIGNGATGIFRETEFSMNSSLYEPNLALNSCFQNMAELMRVVKRIPVETRRLDDIDEVAGCDFLKIDVQGAELSVLQGAKRLLESVLVVQAEVEFVPLYIGQPLFAEVDAEMRRQGFLFHRFDDMNGRAFKPFALEDSCNRSISQLLWADAVYVKDFTRFDVLSAEQLLKLAVLLDGLYQSYDLSGLALQHYDAKTGSCLFANYVQSVTGRRK